MVLRLALEDGFDSPQACFQMSRVNHAQANLGTEVITIEFNKGINTTLLLILHIAPVLYIRIS
jgi:hypothetical protein